MTEGAYIYKKETDWSLFHYGFSIPLGVQIQFQEAMHSFLARGQSQSITLVLEQRSYPAKLQNLKISEAHARRQDILQVRYGQNSAIAVALRALFHVSYQYIWGVKQENRSQGQESKNKLKKHIQVPEALREYLAVYTTLYSDMFLLEAITAQDMRAARADVDGQAENSLELLFYARDETADIRLSHSFAKIRHLDRSIGESLKQLYDCRCQICGQRIGEDYGAPVSEVHHIDYFSRSLNSDSDNLLVVCPNHHRIIHATNPVFDRAKKAYQYPNGTEQVLLLNRHL